MNDFLAQLTEMTNHLVSYAWGLPSVILLVGTGLYLSFGLRFIQIKGFLQAFRFLSSKDSKAGDQGEITPFKALCTGLSATVGAGNIAGVATAIVLGGPGAMFWMWLTAVVGMATRFATVTLALRYRQIGPEGQMCGGPMYTLKYGLNRPILAACYAALTLIASFGIGNMVQANSVLGGLTYLVPHAADLSVYIGIVMALFVGLVIIGGVQRIAQVATVLVPFMILFYVGASLLVIIANWTVIPAAFATIFSLALDPTVAGAGAIGTAVQYGVSRGVFSNEAGLGAAAIAHSATKTHQPVQQGLVAMLGPFIDTIIICSLTGLVIIISGAWGDNLPKDFNGAALSVYAFNAGLAPFNLDAWGAWIVGIGLVFFAFSTILSWSYYGDRCALFLFGKKAVLPYRLAYVVAVVIGTSIPLQLVWNLADIANILMAIPNLLSLILLTRVIKQMTQDYFIKQRERL